MKNKIQFFMMMVLTVLPWASQAQLGPQPQSVDFGEGDVVDRVLDRQVQVGDFPGGNIEQLQPGIGLPVGRHGDCSSLSGATGLLQRQTVRVDDLNFITCFGWNPSGHPAAIVDSAGFLTEFEHDFLGRTLLTRDATGEELQRTYNAKSQLDQMMQSNNWNPTGDPGNRTLQFRYDSVGNRTWQGVGVQSTQQHYTPDADIKAIVGPDSALAKIFDFQGGVLQSTGMGLVNDRGEVTSESLGRTQYQYNRDTGQLYLIRGGAANHETHLHYDAMGRVEEMIFPDGSSTFNRYNVAGTLRWSEVRARNNAILQKQEFTYDDMGRITETRLTKPGNNNIWKTRNTYQDNGLTVMITQLLNDAVYSTVTKQYDGVGRLTSQESPGSGLLTYDYNRRTGRLETLRHSVLGLIQRYNFDALGRLEWLVDGLNNYVRYEYNGLGNLSRIFRAGTGTIQFNYNTSGQLIGKDTGAAQHIGYAYDAAGRLQGFDFGAFPSFRSSFQNETGLLATISMQNQTIFSVLERDTNGNVTRSRDAHGVDYFYHYDTMGRLIQEGALKNGGAQYRNWLYYDDGRVKSVGESVALPADRFAEMRGYGNHSQNAALRVFNRLWGRPTHDNRLKSVVYFAYDTAGNIVEESRWIQGRWLKTNTNYAAVQDALWVTKVYPSGFRMEKKTDAAGRLVLVNARLANGSFVGKATLDYQPNSPRLNQLRFGDDESQERYTYDAAGRITTMSVVKTPANERERQLARIDYKYSPSGALIAKKEQVSPVANQNLEKGTTFDHDDLGRTIFWSAVPPAEIDTVANNTPVAVPSNNDAMQRFFYSQRGDRQKASTRDTIGALLGTVVSGKAFEYTRRFDYAPQTARQTACYLTREGARAGCDNNVAAVDISFDPDGNGNLRAARAGNAAGPTYTYDLFGRLLTVSDPANNNRSIQYYYDGLGRVISREVRVNRRLVSDVNYIWDGSNLSEMREIATRNRSGEVTAESAVSYLYGFGSADVLASYDGISTRYHHSHPDGSVFLLTKAGNVLQWFTYSPFGETRVLAWVNNVATPGTLADADTLRLFGGALIDPLTGFYALGSWYDPVHGQSLSGGEL